MKIIGWILMSVALSLPNTASEIVPNHSYEVGNHYSFHSNILDEEQPLLVALPEGYDEDGLGNSYPVIYVLDGYENQFRGVAASAYMNNSFGAKIPKAIVIGIPSNNRYRDYLPFHSERDFYGNYSKKYKASGGGLKYRKYIKRELFPLIDSKYRTNGQRILVGHSTGAHFALFDLMQSDRLFHSYIAVDPNLWINDWYLGDVSSTLEKTKVTFAGRLFLSIAPRKTKIERQESTLTKVFNGIANISPQPKSSILKRYVEENHQSILPISFHDGLRHIFAGYEPPDFEEVAQRPDILTQHYEQYSKRMGVTYLPDPNFINIAAHTALNHFKNLDKAQQLYQMNVTLYPSRAFSWGALAYYYSSVEDKASAVEAYKKALELNPDDTFYSNRIKELGEGG